MLLRRLSSLLAIFVASSERPACASFSPSRAASSSSPSSSAWAPSSAEPASFCCVLALTLCRSFWTSWICRCRTTCRSSCSRDFWMPELISLDMRLASVSRCSRSSTSSRRCRSSRVSRICCRSSMESCTSVAPTTLVSIDGEDGQRNWRCLPPPSAALTPSPCWPPLASSVIFSWMLCTRARVATSPSSASGSSSSTWTRATRRGVSCCQERSLKRERPSRVIRTDAFPPFPAASPPLAPGPCCAPATACETRRQ
mmetsp:Transcript_56207/g.159540  ORF Transcript_56207/g.159540 Transcript_56207/m.159540 type:complete len:256 (-) Transcript_56207:255-1022(-)